MPSLANCSRAFAKTSVLEMGGEHSFTDAFCSTAKQKLQWSAKLLPTPASSCWRGIQCRFSSSLGPIPDRSRILGESRAPAEIMVSVVARSFV